MIKQNGDAALNREYLLVGYDTGREAGEPC